MTNRITPEISRSDRPPAKQGVWWVECLKGSESQKFLVYSPVVQGVEMHWLAKERRTVPCFANRELCPGGHSEKTLKWRCYIFAFSYLKKKNVFVQLTKEAWESWMSQCREGVNLRGTTIVVHRSEKNNGRLWVEVEAWRGEASGKMAADEDCKLSLFEMWRWSPSELTSNATLGTGFDFPELNGKLT